jgi:hypothetical protein
MSGWARARVRALTALLVALAVLAAVAGTALGARGASSETAASWQAVAIEPSERGASAEPPAEPPAEPAERPKPGFTTIVGRIAAKRGEFLRVRTPESEAPVRVRLLPRTVVKRAGERVEPDALQPGDGVRVVGRLNENGVLQAWGIRARPLPLRPAAERATPAAPADGSASPAPPAPVRPAAKPAPPAPPAGTPAAPVPGARPPAVPPGLRATLEALQDPPAARATLEALGLPVPPRLAPPPAPEASE